MGTDDIGQATERWTAGRRAAGANLSCKTVPWVIHKQSPCACRALFIVRVYTNTTCNIDVDKVPLCAYLLLACPRDAPACVCPLCAHARHLPTRALPMPAHAVCLRVFAMLVFLAYCVRGCSAEERHFTGKSIQRSACTPTRTPDSVGDSSGTNPKLWFVRVLLLFTYTLFCFILSVLQ